MSQTFSFVDEILLQNNVDIFYIIKGGDYGGQISKVCKTVVHCVFDYNQPHGIVYAAVSSDVGKIVVPHMVYLPEYEKIFTPLKTEPPTFLVTGYNLQERKFDFASSNVQK